MYCGLGAGWISELKISDKHTIRDQLPLEFQMKIGLGYDWWFKMGIQNGQRENTVPFAEWVHAPVGLQPVLIKTIYVFKELCHNDGGGVIWDLAQLVVMLRFGYPPEI